MFEQLKEEIFKDWNEGREIRAMQKLNSLDGEIFYSLLDKIKESMDLMEWERFDRRFASYLENN